MLSQDSFEKLRLRRKMVTCSGWIGDLGFQLAYNVDIQCCRQSLPLAHLTRVLLLISRLAALRN
jgi:hypothetical protein